jgi:hypothetical protein
LRIREPKLTIEDERNLDLTRRVLSDVLLRAPRRLHEERWRAALKTYDWIRLPAEQSPIVGVATSAEEGGSVLLLLSRDAKPDLRGLYVSLNIQPRPTRTIISGRIVPAARPAQGGDSISGDGLGGDTGTMGCLVQKDQDFFVLGCNHTLAGINQSIVNKDTVRQPGSADGGMAADKLGTLTHFMSITLGGYHSNTMDAAIADVTNPADVSAGVRSIGSINGVGASLSYGDRVCKYGWKSTLTSGTYRYKVSYLQDFPTVASSALFVDQYGIVGDTNTFAQRGDSGAAVLTEGGNELVGMVIGIAEGMNMTLASPIGPVLSTFGVMPA